MLHKHPMRIARNIQQTLERPLIAAICSLVAGSLAAASMAPLNFWPVLFISLPALYACTLFARSGKMGFLYGWLFGFGYFAFSLSWIGNALLVDGNPYKWAWPLAVSGLPALLAFYFAFAALVAKKLLNLRSIWGWFGIVATFYIFEWLRGHLFTGFPWNVFGYTWADHLPILQILSISDVYFLTWLTVLWACVPACIFMHLRRHKIIIGLTALLTFGGCYLFGTWQLQQAVTYHDNLNIRLVQPNIAQHEKWDATKMAEHFQNMLDLSRNKDNIAVPTIIVWPETALSYRIYNNPQAQAAIRDILDSYPEASALVTGMLRYNPIENSYANSIVTIDKKGHMTNIYDKHHLVPFGEYIPFQKWIPLPPVTQFQGFEQGSGLKTLELTTGHTYSPLVCYEILFPGKSIAQQVPPDFIINVTNDAWYGFSAGPHQHFTQAVFRAIETGTPVIRAANTGFSALIYPKGSQKGLTNLFQTSTRDLRIPRKNENIFPTFNISKAFFPLIVIFFICAVILGGPRFTNRD